MPRPTARQLLALALLLAPAPLAAQQSGAQAPAPAPAPQAKPAQPLYTAGVPGPRLPEKDEAEIRRPMQVSADAWNRADLPGHVADYTENATMMTGRGPMPGREQIGRMLERGFWKDGKPVQQLRFEHLSVRALGRDHALVTGRFVLTGGGKADVSGWYSTTWERTAEGWRMIHDHSS